MKNKPDDEMIRAYQLLLKQITWTGVCSQKTNILDNEASYECKRLITFKNNLIELFLGRPKIPNALVVYIITPDSHYFEFSEAIP